MALPTPDQIAKARQKAEQAKARLAAMEARLSEASRRLDTRRKIILGGLLLDAAEKDERFARVVSTLIGRINRPQDLATFSDWMPPTPKETPINQEQM